MATETRMGYRAIATETPAGEIFHTHVGPVWCRVFHLEPGAALPEGWVDTYAGVAGELKAEAEPTADGKKKGKAS